MNCLICFYITFCVQIVKILQIAEINCVTQLQFQTPLGLLGSQTRNITWDSQQRDPCVSLTPEICCLLSQSPFSPCFGPIGCQQGHSYWEKPMSNRLRLWVKPITQHKAVTLREMLGIAGLCLWAPAWLTESRTPWREEKKAIRQLHHLVL